MSDIVSIITPSYNAAVFIEETIMSVLAQTYKNWELLIVDDCSTDKTGEVVSKYLGDARIHWITQEVNSGPAHTRNVGITHAKGRYIAFLDSDDVWMPDKLSKQLAFMCECHAAICCAGYDVIDEAGIEVGAYMPPISVTYDGLLKTNSAGCLTVMYDRKLLEEKYFDETMKKHEDYVLWLAYLRAGHMMYGVQETLARYRRRYSSVSSNKLKTALVQWKIYRKIEKLPLLKACYFFGHYAWSGLFKYRRAV